MSVQSAQGISVPQCVFTKPQEPQQKMRCSDNAFRQACPMLHLRSNQPRQWHSECCSFFQLKVRVGVVLALVVHTRRKCSENASSVVHDGFLGKQIHQMHAA